MNKWAAQDLFEGMRPSTPQEQLAFEVLLEKYSNPFMRGNIFDMSDNEYGICDICGCQDNLTRTYYYYGIKCDCHSPEHFEIVSTCPRCEPVPPKKIKVEIKPSAYRGAGHNYQIPMRSFNPQEWDYYD